MEESGMRADYDRSKFRSALEPMPVFDEASLVTLQIEVLRESYDEILRVLEANEWGMDEGLTTMLLSGLGLQKGLVHLSEVNGMAARGDAHASQRVDDIVQELAAYHSMYSVMKFKAFKLYKLNQVLEFNNSGLRAQEEMWQEWAERMRAERDELSAELLRMRSLMSEFKLDWEDSGAPPLPPGVFASLKVKELENQPVAEEEPVAPVFILPEEPRRLSFWERVKILFGGRVPSDDR
jgi:hypothetical protein